MNQVKMPERFEDFYDFDRYTYHLLHNAFTAAGRNVKKGDRVVMTEWGKQNLGQKHTEGIITSNPRKLGNAICVRPLGRKTVGHYWAGFWRKKKIPELL